MAILYNPNTYDIGASNPIDSRFTKQTNALRNSIPSAVRYEGLTVYVADPAGNGSIPATSYTLVGGIADVNWTSSSSIGSLWGLIGGVITNVGAYDVSITTSLVVPKLKPSADGATAIQLTQSNGTTVIVNLDTTNNRLGINNIAPVYDLDITGDARATGTVYGSALKSDIISPYTAGSFLTIATRPGSAQAILFKSVGLTPTETMRLTTDGRLGLGVQAPTGLLHLAAGSTTANTAPIKLTSGALMTNPEAGAIEFLTDAFYATTTTGPARKQLAFTATTLAGYGITDAVLKTGDTMTGALQIGVAADNKLILQHNYTNTPAGASYIKWMDESSVLLGTIGLAPTTKALTLTSNSLVPLIVLNSVALATSGVQFVDSSTTITRDGSNNIVFTDAISGSKTLAQLLSAEVWTISGSDIYNANAGNVGIGGAPTTGFKLDVQGIQRITGKLVSQVSGSAYVELEAKSASGYKWRVYDVTNSLNLLHINASGYVGINTNAQIDQFGVVANTTGIYAGNFSNAHITGKGLYVSGASGTNPSLLVADYLGNPLFTITPTSAVFTGPVSASNLNISNWDAAYNTNTDTDLPNGFIDPLTTVTVAFVNGTRTLTLTPSSGSYKFYSDGLVHTKNAPESIIISNSEGIHYIYYDGGTLSETTVFFDGIITTKAIVAIIYWDATNSKQLYFGREYRHTAQMGGLTHEYLHNTQGYRLESGGELGNFVLDGTGNTNTNIQFSNAVAVAWDEDAKFSLPARLSTTIIPKLYRSGADASGIWRIDETTSYVNLSTGSGRSAYNLLSAGTWSLTEVTNTDYVLSHVVATNDTDRPFYVIVGQTQYTTLALARDGATTEVDTLITNGLPFAEFKFLASIVIQTSNSYSDATESRIRSLADGSAYVDQRGSVIGRSGISTTVTNHNSLAGIQGGIGGEYYHLTNAQNIIATQAATTTLDGYLTHTDWNTFNGKSVVVPAALTKIDDTNVTLTLGGTPSTALLQATSLTLGWTGTLADSRIASAATWNGKQTGSTNLTSLTGLTYVSASFVKMTGANTFGLDTTVYAPSASPVFTGNVGISTSNAKYYWENDATNYYLGALTAGKGILGHSYYGWEFNGNSGIGLRVDGSSNIGIGTDTPSSLLHVKHPTDNLTTRFEGNTNAYSSKMYLSASSSGDGGMMYDSNANKLSLFSYSDLTFNVGTSNISGTVGNPRMTILQNGNIGIGTVSPSEVLTVAGNILFTGTQKLIFANDATNFYIQGPVTSSGIIGHSYYGWQFNGDGSNIGLVVNGSNSGVSVGTTTSNGNGTLTVNSTVTASNFILSSDIRLKTNIQSLIPEYVDTKYKQFELISEPGVIRSGVVAQELQETNPELVRTNDDGVLSVAYIDLLVKEIAWLKNEVLQLKERMK